MPAQNRIDLNFTCTTHSTGHVEFGGEVTTNPPLPRSHKSKLLAEITQSVLEKLQESVHQVVVNECTWCGRLCAVLSDSICPECSGTAHRWRSDQAGRWRPCVTCETHRPDHRLNEKDECDRCRGQDEEKTTE